VQEQRAHSKNSLKSVICDTSFGWRKVGEWVVQCSGHRFLGLEHFMRWCGECAGAWPANTHRKGTHLATPILIEIETARSQSFMVRDILPGPGWAPYRPRVHTIGKSKDFLSEERIKEGDCADGKCLKGLLTGVALECVVGMGVFGVWQLWHFVR